MTEFFKRPMEIKGIEKVKDNCYIKKSIFGYSMIYPLKNEDGTWNKKNVRWLLLKILGLVLLINILLYFYNHDINACREAYNNLSASISAPDFLRNGEWKEIVFNNGTEGIGKIVSGG